MIFHDVEDFDDLDDLDDFDDDDCNENQPAGTLPSPPPLAQAHKPAFIIIDDDCMDGLC